MLPYAAGTPCVRCGLPIAPGEAVDLDHHDSGIGYLGMAHARCNRSVAAVRGNTTRSSKRKLRNMDGNVTIGVDVSVDRTHTSIVVAGILEPGITAFDLEYVNGSDAAHRIAAVVLDRGAKNVVVDPRSPATTLLSPLRALGVEVTEVSSAQVACGHGRFIDEWNAGRLRYKAHPALVASFQHAGLRSLAGSEALERRRVDADASPLTAAELAVFGVLDLAPPPMPSVY